jgi:hypothetical protein
MLQPSDDDLRAELAEVRRRLAKLEANDRQARDRASHRHSRAFASKFLPRAFPAAVLMGLGTVLYAASAGNALFIEPNGDVRIEGDVKVGKNVHANTFEGQAAAVNSLTINKVDVASEINRLKTDKADKADVANEIKKLNTDKAEKGGSINQPFKASEIEARYKPNYDSGWSSDNSDTHHKKVFQHNLNYLPAHITIYFSPDPNSADPSRNRIYLVTNDWSPGDTGNPVTVEVSTTQIVLNIARGFPLRGVWNAANDGWTGWTGGYWRVIALGGGP